MQTSRPLSRSTYVHSSPSHAPLARRASHSMCAGPDPAGSGGCLCRWPQRTWCDGHKYRRHQQTGGSAHVIRPSRSTHGRIHVRRVPPPNCGWVAVNLHPHHCPYSRNVSFIGNTSFPEADDATTIIKAASKAMDSIAGGGCLERE